MTDSLRLRLGKLAKPEGVMSVDLDIVHNGEELVVVLCVELSVNEFSYSGPIASYAQNLRFIAEVYTGMRAVVAVEPV